MKTDLKVWDWRNYILNHGPDKSAYRHVLLTLSCFMDENGASCYPTIDTLCRASSLSRTTVIKYLKKADSDGWINKKRQGKSGQGWKRNAYTAQIPEKISHKVQSEKDGSDNIKRSLSDKKGGSAKGEKVVQEVNTNSSFNSPSNSQAYARVNGVPIPENLAEIEGFREKYEFYCKYVQENYNHWPTTTTTEVDLNKLSELARQGHPPTQVIDQTIQARNKSFYPLREFSSENKDDKDQSNYTLPIV